MAIILEQTKRCECGGLSIDQAYGTCCEDCGLILSEIKFASTLRDLEGNAYQDREFYYQSSVEIRRKIGTRGERSFKYRQLARLDGQNYDKRVHVAMLRLKHGFHISEDQFIIFCTEYKKLQVSGFYRNYVWALLLYQMIFQRMTLEEICLIFTRFGHSLNPNNVRKYASINRIPVPRRNFLLYFQNILKSYYKYIKIYDLPDVPYMYLDPKSKRMTIMSSRMNAGVRLYIAIKKETSISRTQFSKLLGISYHKLNMILRYVQNRRTLF